MTSKRRLRSSASHRLEVPPVLLSTVGKRAFPVADANMWNDLPFHITMSSTQSLAVFRQRLKTFLFSRSYPDILIWLTYHYYYHCFSFLSGISREPCNIWRYSGHFKHLDNDDDESWWWWWMMMTMMTTTTMTMRIHNLLNFSVVCTEGCSRRKLLVSSFVLYYGITVGLPSWSKWRPYQNFAVYALLALLQHCPYPRKVYFIFSNFSCWN